MCYIYIDICIPRYYIFVNKWVHVKYCILWTCFPPHQWTCFPVPQFFFFLIKKLFIYLFIFGNAGSSLLCGLFPSCEEQGLLSGCGVQASHCCGFSCCGAWALGSAVFSSCSSRDLEHRLNSRDVWVWLLRNMWDLPGSGIQPVFLVLTGGFFTTEPPGKLPEPQFLNALYLALKCCLVDNSHPLLHGFLFQGFPGRIQWSLNKANCCQGLVIADCCGIVLVKFDSQSSKCYF